MRWTGWNRVVGLGQMPCGQCLDNMQDGAGRTRGCVVVASGRARTLRRRWSAGDRTGPGSQGGRQGVVVGSGRARTLRRGWSAGGRTGPGSQGGGQVGIGEGVASLRTRDGQLCAEEPQLHGGGRVRNGAVAQAMDRPDQSLDIRGAGSLHRAAGRHRPAGAMTQLDAHCGRACAVGPVLGRGWLGVRNCGKGW